MACIPFSTENSPYGTIGPVVGFVCMDDYYGRLHVGSKYVWVSHHRYCGPTFYSDSQMTKMIWPEDENDPIWPAFSAWLDKKEKNNE